MQTEHSQQIRRKGRMKVSQAPPPPSADTAVATTEATAGYLAARLPPLLLLLLTGTLSTVIAQHVLDRQVSTHCQVPYPSEPHCGARL